MAEQQEKQEMWALVELFGHQRIAGKLSEAEFGGGDLVRVDVPALKDRPALTRYFNTKAIYGITPVSEATARRMAEEIHPEPINSYSLEAEVERVNARRSLPESERQEDYP